MRILGVLIFLFVVPIGSSTPKILSDTDLQILATEKALTRVVNGLTRGKSDEVAWKALRLEQRQIQHKAVKLEGDQASIYIQQQYKELNER